MRQVVKSVSTRRHGIMKHLFIMTLNAFSFIFFRGGVTSFIVDEAKQSNRGEKRGDPDLYMLYSIFT